MSVSDNSKLRETYPAAVVVKRDALSRLRGIGGEFEIDRKRVYGLAIEYAIGNENSTDETFDEFLKRRVISDVN